MSTIVTKKNLRQLPSVPFTKTWTPYPHIQIVELMEEVFTNLGLPVTGEHHTLDKNGHNLFSIWDFLSPDHSYAYQIGLRNSTDKSFALGLCSGLKVMVCSNLCFNGDFEIFNIHNNTLTMDKVMKMAIAASQRMYSKSEHTMQWLNGLKEVVFNSSEMRILIFDLMFYAALPPTMFTKYIQTLVEYKTMGAAYDIQNAFTSTVKDQSLTTQQRRTIKANQIIDKACRTYHPTDYAVQL